MQRADRKRAKHYRNTKRCVVSVEWGTAEEKKHCSTHRASWVGKGPCPKRGTRA